MRIAIAAAMEEELAPFRAHYESHHSFVRGKTKIEEIGDGKRGGLLLVETGIGKVNAASATSLLCDRYRPDIIINTGSAGGFSEKLSVGDVVVGSQFRYSDVDATGFDYQLGQVPQMPASYTVAEKWLTLQPLLVKDKDYQIHHGLIVTADSFMSNHQQVEAIKAAFPTAIASDMEGTAIAQVASFYDIPVLNIRGISDIAGSEAAKAFDANIDLAARHAFDQTNHYLQAFQI